MKHTIEMNKIFIAAILFSLLINLIDNTFVVDAKAQSCVQPPYGLVSWWPGDGNANDILDGNDGTLHNGTTFGLGVVGQAFKFDGINDFISVGNPSNLQLSSGDFTVEGWVNFASLVFPSGSTAGPCFGPGCDMDIANKMLGNYPGNLGNNSDGWRLLKQSDNHFWFCFGDGSRGCANGFPMTVRSTTVATPGVWYHVAGVKNANGISIYINGVLEESKPLAPFVDTDSADVLIGLYSPNSGDSFMYGFIDEIGIYNRALSSSNISDIFNAGNYGKCKETDSCDLNDDGKFTRKDIMLFIMGCKQGTISECDLNDDGSFNLKDISAFKEKCIQ